MKWPRLKRRTTTAKRQRRASRLSGRGWAESVGVRTGQFETLEQRIVLSALGSNTLQTDNGKFELQYDESADTLTVVLERSFLDSHEDIFVDLEVPIQAFELFLKKRLDFVGTQDGSFTTGESFAFAGVTDFDLLVYRQLKFGTGPATMPWAGEVMHTFRP